MLLIKLESVSDDTLCIQEVSVLIPTTELYLWFPYREGNFVICQISSDQVWL